MLLRNRYRDHDCTMIPEWDKGQGKGGRGGSHPGMTSSGIMYMDTLHATNHTFKPQPTLI